MGNLWIGTLGDGIFIHTKDNQWLNLKTDDNNHSLSNNRVLSFFQDSSGVIWVGTEGGGLNYFDPYSTIFNHWEQNKTSTRYLNDKMNKNKCSQKSQQSSVHFIHNILRIFTSGC